MQYKGIYRIADHIVQFDTLHNDTHTMCRDYVALGIPEFVVATCQADIDYEREESLRARIMEGYTQDFAYTDGYLETLAVYRKLCNNLLSSNVMLIHGSCIAVDNEAYLFVALSGTGKSTHTRNWRKYFGDRVMMVNDDKPLLDVETMQVYGTPWDGKHHLSNNVRVPLKAVVILNRADNNSIERMPAADVLTRMMQHVYIPTEGLLKVRSFQLLSKLMEKVSFYRLGCNMDVDSARVAWEGIRN